jgi:VWFA-related protein
MHRGFIFAAAAAPALCVFAQSDSPATFRSDTRLVVLHVTVADRAGRLLTDLPASSFSVYENGVAQPIKSFKREDVPVSMGLVVDNSASMRDKRAKVEAAAMVLVKASNPNDEVFVVNFNDEAFLDLPHGKQFTNNLAELQEALARIDARGSTAMRDAIRMSIDHEQAYAHKDKKVLVVVTDGDDNNSDINLENLLQMAQRSEVLIYPIGLLAQEGRSDARRAERALKALAAATGGEPFFPKDLGEVDRIANQVAREIRSQYTIVYTPLNTAMDGAYRQVKVAVNAPGKPVVRTRSGYFATDAVHPTK